MPIRSLARPGHEPRFGVQYGYIFHIFEDIPFNFVLPIILVDIHFQTKFGLNWTSNGYFSPKNPKIGHFGHYRETCILPNEPH